MSIISSGSAAIAIQTLLKKYQLPNLKVLVDNNIEPEVINYLEKIGCGVYKTNLAKKPFTWQEILELTNNPKSKAEKLYSPHLPFAHYDEQWIRLYKQAGYCGPASNVYLIEEKYLDQALDIARSQNIACEPSGIAGLALMLQIKNELSKDKKMLIVNTGKTKYL